MADVPYEKHTAEDNVEIEKMFMTNFFYFTDKLIAVNKDGNPMPDYYKAFDKFAAAIDEDEGGEQFSSTPRLSKYFTIGEHTFHSANNKLVSSDIPPGDLRCDFFGIWNSEANKMFEKESQNKIFPIVETRQSNIEKMNENIHSH
jgi:hypothetical protein